MLVVSFHTSKLGFETWNCPSTDEPCDERKTQRVMWARLRMRKALSRSNSDEQSYRPLEDAAAEEEAAEQKAFSEAWAAQVDHVRLLMMLVHVQLLVGVEQP